MRHHIRVAPLTIFAATALAVLLTGCSGSNSSDDAASTRHARSSSPTATESATPTPTPTPKPKPRLYPKGYPKVVEVSSLPSQVRRWYEGSGNPKAVAVADGVRTTELPPGAGMQDALATEVFDGFCGSIKAYSRKAGSRVICRRWKVTENAV